MWLVLPPFTGHYFFRLRYIEQLSLNSWLFQKWMSRDKTGFRIRGAAPAGNCYAYQVLSILLEVLCEESRSQRIFIHSLFALIKTMAASLREKQVGEWRNVHMWCGLWLWYTWKLEQTWTAQSWNWTIEKENGLLNGLNELKTFLIPLLSVSSWPGSE